MKRELSSFAEVAVVALMAASLLGDPARAEELLRQAGLSAAPRPDGLLSVGVADREGIARVNALLVGEGLAVSHLALEEASLERAFLALVANAPEGAAS